MNLTAPVKKYLKRISGWVNPMAPGTSMDRMERHSHSKKIKLKARSSEYAILIIPMEKRKWKRPGNIISSLDPLKISMMMASCLAYVNSEPAACTGLTSAIGLM